MGSITLVTTDGVVFEIPREAYQKLRIEHQSVFINNLLEDCSDDTSVAWTFPADSKITCRVMEVIVDFYYSLFSQDFDAARGERYIDISSTDLLFEVAEAASYLIIEGLVEFTAVFIAELIRGKTPDQIREAFVAT